MALSSSQVQAIRAAAQARAAARLSGHTLGSPVQPQPTSLDASAITSGVFPPERLGGGSPSAATFLRGDSRWTEESPGGTSVVNGGTF